MNRKLFLSLLLAVLVFSCKRDAEPPKISFVFDNVDAVPDFTSCDITCRNESVDNESVFARLLLSENEDLTDASKYYLIVIGDSLRCKVASLNQGTIYYFGFEMYTNVETYRMKDVYSFETRKDEIKVTTSEVSNITQTSATGGGNVSMSIEGNGTVSERGICWSTNHNPTNLQDSHASSEPGSGPFSVNMTGLLPSTTYYVRAYAVIGSNIYFGNEVNFTTASGTFSLTTNEVTNITQTTATGGGNMIVEDDTMVTELGICWSTNHNPTNLQDSHASTEPGNGPFTVNMTGLLPETTYYARAYAVIDRNIYFGNEVSFTTLQQSGYTINISADPSNGGTVTGGGTFQQGQQCTVKATTNTGYTFVRWTEGGIQVSADANYTFTVNSNRTLMAHFTASSYVISASANPEEGGTITGTGGYEYGQRCTLVATANTGYTFTKWTENGTQVSTNANYTFTVTGSRNLVAHFQAQSYTITASAKPSIGGTVSGSGTYNYGQSCTMQAIASNGYSFVNWTENGNQVSANANYTFTVNGNRTLVAHFTASSYVISASANPEEGGTITGSGGYEYGQNCTLRATANTGYTFTKWTENGSQVSNNANYSFTVEGSRNLVAQFQAQSYTITASANPSNGGSVSGGGTFNYGQSCTVHATAATGYTFVKWTENGNQVSTNANYTFTVTGNRALVAQFQQQSYSISVSANPSSGGTVSGGGTYNYGQSCTVHATANNGYTFSNWTENGNVVSTNANYTFSVNGNRTLVAQFQQQTYTISVSANPSSGGSVSGGGTYNYGQSCTVSATAATGYTFVRWTENGNQVSTNANYTFTVNGNRTLVAQFQQQSYSISVSANPSSGGSVSGGGTYNYGQSCTVHATANNGYAFTNWTENGNVVSTNANYTFSVTGNRTLVANFNYNGGGTHEYVDLGLPSGLLWATCNIGADSPEAYGDYFAWGETQPKDYYDWSTYQHCMGDAYTLTKYCYDSNHGYNGFTDNLTVLEACDDAATAQWGSGWRMPTKTEWQELLNNTTYAWTTQNGVYGGLFTASNGNSLFLPAAGSCSGSSTINAGYRGEYWSSSLYTNTPAHAEYFTIVSTYCGIPYTGIGRHCGQSVRAVRTP